MKAINTTSHSASVYKYILHNPTALSIDEATLSHGQHFESWIHVCQETALQQNFQPVMSERQPYVTPSSVFDRAEELLLSSVPSRLRL
jgi:hypothetical protein